MFSAVRAEVGFPPWTTGILTEVVLATHTHFLWREVRGPRTSLRFYFVLPAGSSLIPCLAPGYVVSGLIKSLTVLGEGGTAGRFERLLDRTRYKPQATTLFSYEVRGFDSGVTGSWGVEGVVRSLAY